MVRKTLKVQQSKGPTATSVRTAVKSPAKRQVGTDDTAVVPRPSKKARDSIVSAVQHVNQHLMKLHADSMAKTTELWMVNHTPPDSSEPFDFKCLLLGDGDKRKPNGVAFKMPTLQTQTNICKHVCMIVWLYDLIGICQVPRSIKKVYI